MDESRLFDGWMGVGFLVDHYISILDIAKVLGVSPSTITSCCNRLEQKKDVIQSTWLQQLF